MTKQVRFRSELLGKKLGMMQYFNEEGQAIPVTVIELGENIITDIKTPVRDGYSAIQIGTNIKKEKHLNKPKIGNLKKKNLELLGSLREFKVKPEELDGYKVGEKIDPLKIIVVKEYVDVTGTSIGKGFQGMVKLHNKQRGFKSHGSKSYRGPGSIGAHTYPGRVLPGKKMPSRMGNETVTARNLQIIDFIQDKNLLVVKGAVPGVEGSMVIIKSSIKKWNKVA